ncbi:MAG: hypothetical protein H6536_02880 [Bacteroidales bacterium]|nr:hypothetical protein [Bacteroidales bacterium]
MKSSNKDLESRGFLKNGAESAFANLPNLKKLELLKSPIPTERTLGARLAKEIDESAVSALIAALKVEKKLYPKIEICNTLVECGIIAVKPLIQELGQIGSNQHKDTPNKSFEKDSYPLPRDIAARTLAHIGKDGLPDLLKVQEENNLPKLSEAIDAIGYICFYNNQPEVFEKLKSCYKSNTGKDLICWKLIRAMSGFFESIEFLMEQRAISINSIIKQEIERSIRLINKRCDSIGVHSISQ